MSDGVSDIGAAAIPEPQPRDPRGVLVRLLAFAVERFPPPPQLVLAIVLWGAGITMPAALLPFDAKQSIDLAPALLTLLGLVLFLFHLRVMDDVKDADHDRIHETDRPVPRGLVSERELDVLTVVLLLVELPIFAQIAGGLEFGGSIATAVGANALVAWAIAAAYSVLMRVEFFAGEFLDRHVLTFATSHMAVMGLVFFALWVCALNSIGGFLNFDYPWGPVLLACVAATALGLGFEFGRKFERYQLGHGRVAWLLWAAMPSLGALGFAALACAYYPSWTNVTMWTLVAVTIVAHAIVVVRTRTQHAKTEQVDSSVRGLVELLPGITGLLVYLVLAVAGTTLGEVSA